ncbi:MAG: oxygen-independent coproporphyrinogen III oxidase [Nitrosomonas sp.]|nr:oxygen-independent coproporphyrinogen III oxidase [Nitrosomonas sp.]
MYSQQPIGTLEVDLDVIRRFDIKTPNYPLYPDIDYFVETFDSSAHASWANNRKIGGTHRPLSIYTHIPFCSSSCFYCKYNHIVTNKRNNIEEYIGFLLREIKLQGELFQNDTSLEQIYFGGGTPSLLNDDQLHRIVDGIHQYFSLTKNGECAIEVDPRLTTTDSISMLRAIGFNSITLGVQDFNHEVQKAVHRIQNEEDTLRVIHDAQQEKFRSINIDLIYGLPKQSIDKFDRTLEKIINARPNRISLVNYIHSPEKYKAQRHIRNKDLPLTEAKLEIIQHAINQLTKEGYIHIGINHFARHDDKLVVALQQGRLCRNFQGYSTQANCDLIGLGISAIGSIGPTYSQNDCNLDQYYDKLKKNRLPIMHGLELTADDLLRRLVMHMLMCNSILSFESIETAFPVNFKGYFTTEMTELLEYEQSGLLVLGDEEILITPKGRLSICSICAVFDQYQRTRKQHGIT